MSNMPSGAEPEVWLRGPIAGVTPALQPVAHAVLQAREEVGALMQGFPDDRLWERPAGAASVGFHLRHMAGVIERLTCYAQGQALSEAQLTALRGESLADARETTGALVGAFETRVERFIEQLGTFEAIALTEHRAVGRSGLPSTTLGLLVHAAEHTMRHLGALLVTVRLVSAPRNSGAGPPGPAQANLSTHPSA